MIHTATRLWPYVGLLLTVLLAPTVIKIVESRLLRRQRLDEFRYTFHRDALIETQSLIDELHSGASKTFGLILEFEEANGRLPQGKEIRLVSAVTRELNGKARMLITRLPDASHREAVEGLWNLCSGLPFMLNTHDQLMDRVSAIGKEVDRVQELIGTALRERYL